MEPTTIVAILVFFFASVIGAYIFGTSVGYDEGFKAGNEERRKKPRQ